MKKGKKKTELVPTNRQWCRIKMNLIGEHIVTGRQVPVLQYSQVNLIKPSKGCESRIRAKSSCQCHFYIKIHPTQGNSLPIPALAWAAHESSNLICGDSVRPISKRQHMQSYRLNGSHFFKTVKIKGLFSSDAKWWKAPRVLKLDQCSSPFAICFLFFF